LLVECGDGDHACGIAAGCDGIIIEVHPNPKKSLVDPLQPLNFHEFKKLMKTSRAIAKAVKRKIY
jgi:3-deoxy-7-phosphoheptulonate synthase